MSFELDGLALEYQRVEGHARWNLDLADFVNDPMANGVCHVLSLGFPEQLGGLSFGDSRSFGDHLADSLVVTDDSVHQFAKVLFLQPHPGLWVETHTVEHESGLRDSVAAAASQEDGIPNGIDVADVVSHLLKRHSLQNAVQVHPVHHGAARCREQ